MSARAEKRVTSDADDALLVVVYWDRARAEVACGFEGGAVLRATRRQLGLPEQPPVVLANIDELRTGFHLIREDGSTDDCAADFVQYLARRPSAGAPAARGDLALRVAAAVRRLRHQRGLSQAAIAKSLGVAAPNYARLEAGRHAPSVRTIVKLAEIFGVPLEALVGAQPRERKQRRARTRS